MECSLSAFLHRDVLYLPAMNAPEPANPVPSAPARLNYFQILVLGFGYFGVSVIWSIYNAFIPTTLEHRFGLLPPMIGFFMTLDNTAQLIIQPPVGAWSDRLRTPLGRRLPFIMVGAPLAGIAFGLIPLAHALPLFVACTTTLLISMALWRTPAVALIGDLVPSEFRSQANGIVNFMGGIGAIFAYFGGAHLTAINPAYPFWMGSVLVLLAMIAVFLFIREPKTYQTSDIEEVPLPGLWQNLQEIIQSRERSTLLMLLAIFFWMIGYSAIEGFFTLYTTKYLLLKEADGSRLLGQMSLVFVLFALPAGYAGAFLGRRLCIGLGLVILTAVLMALYLVPVATLTTPLFALPLLGVVPIVGALLMVAGIAWAFINIHALPMILDMTDDNRIGTYTGLYYLFSTFAAILGPNLNGWMVQLNGGNYNAVMLLAAFCMTIAFVLMLNVRKGDGRHKA
jgi:maltose/moltooligosaccharide transporter